MKKLITVLAILVVLVGAVFADDTNTDDAKKAYGEAQIVVKAKIPEAVPMFELKTSDEQSDVITGGDSTITAATVANHTATIATRATSDATLIGNAITTLSNTENGSVSINFDIIQSTKANLKAKYKVEITATELKLKTFLDGKTLEESNVTYNAGKHSFTVETPVVSAVTTSPVGTTLAPSGNVLNVTYSGANQVTAQKLGQAAVKWNSNVDAVSGNYEATVLMAVTAQ